MLPIIGGIIAGAVEVLPWVVGAAAANWAVDSFTGFNPIAAAGEGLASAGGYLAGGEAITVSCRSFDVKTASGIRARRGQSDEEGTCMVSVSGGAWKKHPYEAAYSPAGELHLKIADRYHLVVPAEVVLFAEDRGQKALPAPAEKVTSPDLAFATMLERLEKLMSGAGAPAPVEEPRLAAAEKRLDAVEASLEKLTAAVEGNAAATRQLIDFHKGIAGRLEALSKPAPKPTARTRAGRPTTAASA